MKTPKNVRNKDKKYVKNKDKKYQNNFNDVTLVSLLLTLQALGVKRWRLKG